MYWNKKWYPGNFYLLDYLSRENDCRYVRIMMDIRNRKMTKSIYSRDIMVALKLNPTLEVRKSGEGECDTRIFKIQY